MQLSADVDGLLAAANIPGPFVVAGHSVGGAYRLPTRWLIQGTLQESP